MSAGGQDLDHATELARQQLGRRNRSVKRLLVASLVVSFVCICLLALETASAVRLQDHGRQAWARVDHVSDGRFPGLIVSYSASDMNVFIPVWFSTGSYSVGERVLISYDQSEPSHAVIPTGFPAPSGWHGWPIRVLIACLILVVCALVSTRWPRRSDPILLKPPRPMSVVTNAIAGTDDIELTLVENGQPIATMGQLPIQEWGLQSSPRALLIYGTPLPNETVIAVDLENETARLWRLRAPTTQ